MIESGIVALLHTDHTLSALVGSHIYPLLLPEDFLGPGITYQLISNVSPYMLVGPIGLVQARFQFDAWATSYASAKTISIALRRVLDNYGPAMLPDGTRCLQVEQTNATDYYEPDSRLYRVGADYLVMYAQ